MMLNIAADMIRRKLAELSDQEMLQFVKTYVLDHLSHVQLVKLQELVNTEVGMEEWFVNIEESRLQLTALKLDLATLQKVQGVFTEAEVEYRHRLVEALGQSGEDRYTSRGPADTPSWMRSGRHG